MQIYTDNNIYGPRQSIPFLGSSDAIG